MCCRCTAYRYVVDLETTRGGDTTPWPADSAQFAGSVRARTDCSVHMCENWTPVSDQHGRTVSKPRASVQKNLPVSKYKTCPSLILLHPVGGSFRCPLRLKQPSAPKCPTNLRPGVVGGGQLHSLVQSGQNGVLFWALYFLSIAAMANVEESALLTWQQSLGSRPRAEREPLRRSFCHEHPLPGISP